MRKRHSFSMWKGFLFAMLWTVSLGMFAQTTHEIKGVVVDGQTNDPIIGATVHVPGTSAGAATDIDGNFALRVPASAKTVEVSYIGYRPISIPFNPQRLNDFRVIQMYEDAELLDEVTVVAFAKQKKESVVGSVTSVNVNELKVPSSNLTTSFAGRVAGLIAYQTSGEPGRDNAEFFVRGVTTFGTGKKDPLILIDNIELTSNDLSRLNPDDISSFSVLKDATATALYGARGANGVILVTTKEGKEGKVQINIRHETAFSGSTREVDVADPITFMKMHNEATRTRDPLAPLPYSQSSIAAREAGGNPYVYPMVDWKDMLFKPYTVNNRTNINLSGGGTVARYYVALGYANDNGLLKVDPVNNFNNNISLNKYNVRTNVNINLTKTTELAARVSGTFDDYQGPIRGGAEMYNFAIKSNPVLFPAKYAPDEENKHAKHILFGNYGEDSNYMNPYAEMLRGYSQYNTTVVTAQLELKQKLDFITEGLDFRLMGNAHTYSNFSLQRAYSPFYYNIAGYDKPTDTYRLASLNEDRGTDYLGYDQGQGSRNINRSFYVETQLNYARTFNDKHDVGGLLVFTGRENLHGNASSLQKSLAERNLNLSGRFTYGYDTRYFGEFNFGYNGSEKFNKAHRWGFFPSVGASWIVSNEAFWQNSTLAKSIPSFKFRGTYGLVGNDAISDDRFFYLSEVNMNNDGRGYTFGRDFGKSVSGISISRYADDLITWEVSYKSNYGLVMNLFNKIDFEVDYFTERRTNILMTRADIPTTMGLQAIPKANIGEALGKGVDMSLNIQHFFKPDFWVTAMGNFTYASSKFSIYEEPDYSQTTPWLSRTNQKISQPWGLIAERLFVDEIDVANSPRQQYGEYGAGDIKYKDINGDDLIDDRDMVPIGYPTTPEITYGFGVSTGYKNFDFSVFFQGQGRNSFFINAGSVAPFVNGMPDGVSQIGTNAVLKFIENSHWNEENQNIYALWPRLSTKQMGNNTKNSTWWLRDGSFLRFKSLELGYTLPKKFTNKLSMEGLRVYFSGTNLFTFSNFDLWDIEMRGNGLGYPNQRVLSVGLHVNL